MKQISREIFEQQRGPRFGSSNPERMQCAFWEWMIRGEEKAPVADEGSLEEIGLRMRHGKLKSAFGPYRARDLFQVPLNREDGPIWTFERYGATQTELPDGRVICVGGEHEDSYDPDFHIYNDVVVFHPDGEIEIYGYPKEAFQPTDFHSATLVGNKIVVIGCLGYGRDRRPGFTPVYKVDTQSYRISELATSGTVPGWIFEHVAEASVGGKITVRSGRVVDLKDGKRRFRRNNEEFSLDLNAAVWAQTTNRSWPQWSIRQEDGGLFILDHDVRLKDLVPEGVERIPTIDEQFREAKFLLRGVPIRVIVGVSAIEIVAEGDLPEKLRAEVPDVFQRRVEILCKKKCVVE